jgi:hypothetical protein
LFRPSFISRLRPEFSQAILRNVLSASVIPYFGIFDRGLVVPAVVGRRFIEAPRGGEIGHCSVLGIAVTAPAERSPAAGRELKDPCGSLT